MSASDEENTCAVCKLAEDEGAEKMLMPCCGVEGQSTWFCRRCLEIICEMGTSSVGKCPACRSYYRFEENRIVTCENRGQCLMCRQPDKVLVQEVFCAACMIGIQYRLSYECQRCRQTQQISHPMWRYQESPTAPSTASWFCHQGCEDYTNWVIVADDIDSIPQQEIPESWGRHEDWLNEVRERRQQERNNSGSAPEAQQSATETDTLEQQVEQLQNACQQQ
eukprot:TRINITY_DN739_c1_g2_i1.p1 TRINITY_DN739_c1_g2~~TRINITY_DN739_c1_g2_i1.p1  ORF type:complete len:222 (+),score=28.79 TRINITY_DN739_c1_g2_i1:109-774(+)